MKLKEIMEDLVTQVNNKMKIIFTIFIVVSVAVLSCKPTKKIQTAMIHKDSTARVVVDSKKADSLKFIKQAYSDILAHHIDFRTFSGKVDVDYVDADDKRYNLDGVIRMQKDSVIWVSISAIFGIEAIRALITTDSVKILDKHNRLYTARSIKYLQEVSAVPFDLPTLQDLLIGNAVFLDSNIVSYRKDPNSISLLSIGRLFKNLITIAEDTKLISRIKLDDIDELRNRTGDVTYSDYDDKRGPVFATVRKITFAEKKKLDIRLRFKQYSFNDALNFPFSVPKNYERN